MEPPTSLMLLPPEGALTSRWGGMLAPTSLALPPPEGALTSRWGTAPRFLLDVGFGALAGGQLAWQVGMGSGGSAECAFAGRSILALLRSPVDQLSGLDGPARSGYSSRRQMHCLSLNSRL